MLWKESEAVSEGNGPVHQEKGFWFGQPEPVDVYRQIKKLMMSHFEQHTKMLEKRLTSLEHGAGQPRLAMEADGPANTKTRERTEGAATVVQAMRGDSFTARRVEPGPNTSSTSFGVKAEPPALPCRDDVVVESDDAAPKSCLPSLEMRSSTAAGGLVPTGEASTATETNFNQPPIRFHSTEETDSETSSKETNLRTSTQYASYDSSVFQESNLPPALSDLRVIETKPIQNITFDPGGSQDRLRTWPSLGSWHALVCGEVVRAGAVFWRIDYPRLESLQESCLSKLLCHTYSVFRRRFADSLKQGQPRIHWAGKSLAVEGRLRLHELEVIGRRNGGHVVEGDSR